MTTERTGNLTPLAIHVLLAFAEGPLHGYAVMKAVEELSESSLSTGPGNIYGAIQRMEEAGLVRDAGRAEGRRRRLYALTPAGRKALRTESGRLARLADLLRAKGLAPKET